MTISQKFSGTLWSRLRRLLQLVVVLPPGHSVQRKQPVASTHGPTRGRAGLGFREGERWWGWRERSGGGRKMRRRWEISSPSLLLLPSMSRYFWRLTNGLGQMFPRWNERMKMGQTNNWRSVYINRTQFRRICFCGCGQKCMYIYDVVHGDRLLSVWL